MPHAEPSFALAALLGRTLPCTCGVQHVMPTREVVLEADALLQVPAVCARHFSGQQVLLVDDVLTHDIAGARVSQLLRQNGYGVEGLRALTEALLLLGVLEALCEDVLAASGVLN